MVGLITVGVLAYAALAAHASAWPVSARLPSNGAMFGVVIPNIDAMWPSERVWAASSTSWKDARRLSITTLGYREPSNAFYLGTNTLLADNADAAADVLAGDPALRACRC